MANFRAIHSVGESVVTYLKNTYPADLRASQPCDFRLINGGQLAADEDFGTALTLLLYRITIDEHLRNSQRANASPGEHPPLAIDLQYLLTVWASSPLIEQTILGWAMQQLHTRPILDAASLTPDANWGANELVQIIPSDLSTEDLMRIWAELEPKYRLSVCYTARVIRLDVDVVKDGLPAVATRFQYSNREDVT